MLMDIFYSTIFSISFVFGCWSLYRKDYDRANTYFAIAVLLFISALYNVNSLNWIEIVGTW